MPRQTIAQKEADLVAEVIKNFGDADAAESQMRSEFTADLRFLYEPGAQWDPIALSRRQGRPNYSYNRCIGPVNQLIGDQRQQQPQLTVSPASDTADMKKANVIAGMIRDIMVQSSASSIFNMQFKYAASGGFGHWRVMPEFGLGKTFDQCLRIKDIPNPLTVFFDSASMDPWKRDAMWCVVAERMSKDRFKTEHPGFEPASLQTLRDGRGWVTDDEVRVAEYFKRICKKRTIAELSDGRIIDYDTEARQALEALNESPPEGVTPPTVVRTRKVDDWKIQWWKVDGTQVLEGPIEYDWKMIPIVRLPGRYINIEGKPYLSSLIRYSKDAQRTYNYNRSTQVELASLTPRAPYLATAKMIKGYEPQWNNANVQNQPYLLYDVDPSAPSAAPTRQPPIEIAPAFGMLAAADAEDIRATSGVSQAGLGEQGNERSGVALDNRQMESDVGAYEFTDNYREAYKLTCEICADMIPSVYDTARTVSTLGVDGKAKMQPINGEQPDQQTQGGPQMQDESDQPVDLLDGAKYNIEITMGPAYTTQRRNALDTLLALSEKVPIFAELAPDLIAKNLDVQGADELEQRVRKKLVMAGIIEPTKEEAAKIPPPPPPDPIVEATVQSLQAKAEKDSADAKSKQADTAQTIADLHASLTDTAGQNKQALETQKMMEDIINVRLKNMVLSGELGIEPASGKLMLRAHHSENKKPGNGSA